MFRRLLSASFLSLLLISCKELEDYEPYENKKPKAPVIYNMDAIGLTEGATVGECLLSIDIIKLFESNTKREFKELEDNIFIEFFVDGESYGGSSSYLDAFDNCEINLKNFGEGMHNIVIKIVPSNYNYVPSPDNLSSYFNLNGKEIIFSQNLFYKREELGDITITRSQIIQDSAYIEWTYSGGEPAVYRFFETYNYDQPEIYNGAFFFGPKNSYQYKWDESMSYDIELEYTNRNDSETKRTTVYLQ